MMERLRQHRDAGRDYRIASGGGTDAHHDGPLRSGLANGATWMGATFTDRGRAFHNARDAVTTLYAEDPDIDDQWLPAFVIHDADGPVGRIEDHHAVLFFNFRGDRAIEISQAFSQPDFDGFPQPNRPDVYYAGMMQYDGDTHMPQQYLVEPPAIDETVGEYLVRAGKRTFAVSETQKYGHVTFFFNGNRSGCIDSSYESYLEIPSDNVPFDQRPMMKAREITDAAVHAIGDGYDHVRLNLANGDMVGHTGNLAASITAVECVDQQLARIESAVTQAGGLLLITADHGNADEMFMRKGENVLRDASGAPLPRTSHTLNPVPFIVFDPKKRVHRLLDQPASIASCRHHDFGAVRYPGTGWISTGIGPALKKRDPHSYGTSVPPMLRHRFRPSDIQ